MDRVAGVLGGVVCGLLVCVIGFRVRQMAGIGVGPWFIFAAFVLVVSVPAGLVGHRYFGGFLVPVFNFFSGGGEDWDHSNRSLLCCIALLVAIIALLLSFLIQSQVAFVIGLFLFLVFAITSPRAFADEPSAS